MKVSVLVMTYNHVNFIAQALDSILMQQVNFDYEILISEDCSTDGTREIVLDYYQQFPDRIRLLLSEKNVRSNQVVARGIHAAQGQYIALLDGDDFWLSPHKLQKQVEFLDSHLDCALCFHNAQVVREDGTQECQNWTPDDQKQFSTLEDMWLGNFIATCSTMFRRGLFGEVPEWYDDFFPITDWPLHLLNAEHGLIGYIDEVMGAYRHHSGGLYSPFSQLQKLNKTLEFYQKINACLEFKYDQTIKSAISNYFLDWAIEYEQQRELEQAKYCFRVCLLGKPVNKFISLKKLIKVWAKLYILPVFDSRRWAHQ
ncbi:glycosyltransferase [Nodosilinea sp. PGN35]|uniref:glycosyltransferase n=1 Tax=Nodosilinea sp. PGN35 TaxID=3020489 RepID=UPI0023B24886|nr:glycosyltransferase [Nodosilinea sp. TSF1-S3]MDF0367329.1 glycosyltransferase [Nodosilinea sp. TSF1-S3]